MKAKLLDYNTGKHYDVSSFFSEDALKRAYYLRTNMEFIKGVFTDAIITKRITYRDDDLVGHNGKFYLPAHAALIEVKNGTVTITELSENAIEVLGEQKIVSYLMDAKYFPYEASARLAKILMLYSKFMKLEKEEIAKRIMDKLII